MNMDSNHKGHEYVVYVGTYTDKNDPDDPATRRQGATMTETARTPKASYGLRTTLTLWLAVSAIYKLP